MACPAGRAPSTAPGASCSRRPASRPPSWRELARVHLSNSVSDELAVLFVATGLSHGDATPDGTEQLAIRWLPFAEVLAMTLDGRITDAMTVIAVERLALLRALEATRG